MPSPNLGRWRDNFVTARHDAACVKCLQRKRWPLTWYNNVHSIDRTPELKKIQINGFAHSNHSITDILVHGFSLTDSGCSPDIPRAYTHSTTFPGEWSKWSPCDHVRQSPSAHRQQAYSQGWFEGLHRTHLPFSTSRKQEGSIAEK